MSLQWRTFAGGWYGAGHPNGAYAVQVPLEDIQTDRGSVDLPPGELWGVQIYDIEPDGTFAGLGHTGNGNVWEYVPGIGWHLLPFVTGRGKYAGMNWIDLLPAGTGFIDDSGQPVSRINTFEANRGLNNWIATGGLLFGQGNPEKGAPCEGLVLWDGTAYRQLFAGSCMELVLHRDGDQFALTFRQDKVGVHFGIFTRQQLLAVPTVDTHEPPPPPKPPKPPLPPFENKMMKLPADVHATFTACVQKFPHDGDDDARREAMAKAVETIRARHGLRYVWKSEHSNLSSPSKDGMGFVPLEEGTIIEGQRKRMFIWDMINGTTRQPNDAGESEPIREAYVLTPEPKDWLAGSQPPPDNPPPPDADEIEKLWAEVGELRTLVRHIDQALVDTDATARMLADRVTQLERKPDPVMKLPRMRARGSTGRAFGHAHPNDLEVYEVKE